MKTLKLLQGFIIAGLLSLTSLELEAFTTKPKSVVKLNSVFTNEVNVRNKEMIKLYDDLSYEFLFFEFYNKKPRVKREKGTYSLKKQKLTLKNSGKTQPKEHPERFIIKENEGLFACNRFGKIDRSSQSSYLDNKDRKYWEETYKDSVFGEITNDRKATRKIVEVKPVYEPVAKEFIASNYEHYKTESDIVDLSLISRDSLRKLKAIIIVGSVENLTGEFIVEQQKTAAYLRSVGVRVFEFYHPHAKWNDIVKESEGAHIFIYAGHGTASVLCLTDGIVYGSTIEKELKLHKNALVIFNHACESAGSSATDKGDIGKVEALRRVGDYAKPYVDLKAGAYFANNYYNCLPSFLNSFFQRTRMKDLYTQEATNYAKIEVVKKYNYDFQFEIGVSSNKDSKGISDYNVAYVGKPNYTVNDLFK